MASATIRTRILIISDTHCAPLSKDAIPPFRAPLPKADLLIHCGDLTMKGGISQYEKTLDMLKAIDAPVKLVIAGNHDLDLDREYVLGHLGRDKRTPEQGEEQWRAARDLWTAPDGRARQEGVTFLDEGFHRIDLPIGAAANIYASPYTPEFYDWGFPYERNEDRFNMPENSFSDVQNIASNPPPTFSASTSSNVDIMITHGPPWARLDQTDRGDYAGCPHLLRALMRAKPLLHCFGHIHEGWGAERLVWSDLAVKVAQKPSTMADWTDANKWRYGIANQGETIEKIQIDRESIKRRGGSFLDMSATGGQPLRRGQESLLVNAAIMDVKYKPVNSQWIVDIDLPRSA